MFGKFHFGIEAQRRLQVLRFNVRRAMLLSRARKASSLSGWMVNPAAMA
jgi:hypothetical protein